MQNISGTEKSQSEGLQLLIARPQRKTKKKKFLRKSQSGEDKTGRKEWDLWWAPCQVADWLSSLSDRPL